MRVGFRELDLYWDENSEKSQTFRIIENGVALEGLYQFTGLGLQAVQDVVDPFDGLNYLYKIANGLVSVEVCEMNKMFIVADTHGVHEVHKIFDIAELHPHLTRDDYVVVCGDFGLVWNDSSYEKEIRDKINNLPFTTLVVAGNHENFDLLETFPSFEWKGGRVRYIHDNILLLERGEVFTINEKTFFTMGGGTSIDREYRVEGSSWWRQEMPSSKEFYYGFESLDEYDWTVDYVLTHVGPPRIVQSQISYYTPEYDPLESYFNILQDELTFSHWFFGHMHEDFVCGKYTLLYEKYATLYI